MIFILKLNSNNCINFDSLSKIGEFLINIFSTLCLVRCIKILILFLFSFVGKYSVIFRECLLGVFKNKVQCTSVIM